MSSGISKLLSTSIVLILAVIMCTAVGWSAAHEHVLHTFKFNPGGYAYGTLVADPEGNLFGTTLLDAKHLAGTVYEVSPQPGGGWKFQNIHTFDGTQGWHPTGNMVRDSAGNLYGVTAKKGPNNRGTIFELSPNNGKWSEKTIYAFDDKAYQCYGLAIDANGNLYGGTYYGGADGQGTVFELTPSNGQWTFSVLHDFTKAEGGGPATPLVFDAHGNLYGGQWIPRAPGYSGIFTLTPNGDGTWTESTVYTFNPDTDGGAPNGLLTFDGSGNIYGVNYYGGPHNAGTAFELTPGNGKYSITVLHAFDNNLVDGVDPTGGLTLDASGNLYGATSFGGPHEAGTLFKLTQSNGRWKESILHSFSGGADGEAPTGAFLRDGSGHIFGTTSQGGYHGPLCGNSGNGCGVVFEITP